MAKQQQQKDKPMKPETAKNAVATQHQGSAVTEVVPDFMKGHAGRGSENVQASDLLIPRIALLQATSPQVTEQGEKVGEFYHTVLEESLGAELAIVPIIYTRQLILWNPKESGGGILARANWNNTTKEYDPWTPSNVEFKVKFKGVKNEIVWNTKSSVKESRLLEWGTQNPEDEKSQPAATEVHSFLCVDLNNLDVGPFIVAMQRSAVKAAKKWLTRLTLKDGVPFYGQKFKLTASDDQNKSGEKFKNYSFKADGLVEDKSVFEELFAVYKRFQGQSFDIKDVEKMQGDTADEASTGNAPVGKVSEKF